MFLPRACRALPRMVPILLGLLCLGGDARAEWTPDGLALRQVSGAPTGMVAAADRAGGTVVAWIDPRVGENRIFAARILDDGNLDPNWPVNGIMVSTIAHPQRDPQIVADPSGGTFILFRSVDPNGEELVLQHLQSTGLPAPGSPPEGEIVGPAAGPTPGRIAIDELGHVFVAHVQESGISRQVRVFRFTAAGAPDATWPLDGVLAVSLARDATEVFQGGPIGLAPDAAGGCWVFAQTDIQGPSTTRRRNDLARIEDGGTFPPAWPGGEALELVPLPGGASPCGVAIGSGFLFAYGIVDPQVGGYSTIRGRRIDPGGQVEELGVLGDFYFCPCVQVFADGLGGAFVEAPEIARPVNRDIVHYSFPASGATRLWSWFFGTGHNEFIRYDQGEPFPDLAGGVYTLLIVTGWSTPSLRMYHVNPAISDPAGSAYFGVPVRSIEANTTAWVGLRNHSGGITLAWIDDRNGQPDIYYDGSNAITLTSLRTGVTKVDVAADGVRIDWWIDGDAQALRLERQERGSEFVTLGDVQRISPDAARSTDTSVLPGHGYEYRLAGETGGQPFASDLVHVDVPTSVVPLNPGFSIMAPSPQRGTIEFQIRGISPAGANVRCSDARGRTIAVMKGAWGEGETVRVRPPVALAAGVYFLEARSGTAVARARVVVLP